MNECEDPVGGLQLLVVEIGAHVIKHCYDLGQGKILLCYCEGVLTVDEVHCGELVVDVESS